MNIIESLNRGLETKYHLNEAKEDKERFKSFVNDDDLYNRFELLKSKQIIRGQDADYTYWEKQSINALKDFIEKTEAKQEEKNKKRTAVTQHYRQISDLIESEDYNFVYSGNGWTIYEVLTHKASMWLGKDTKWCITMKDNPSFFNQYKNEGANYYFLIPDKNPESGKWCYLYYNKELNLLNNYFWDSRDNSHTIENVDIPDDVLLSLPGISQKIFDDVQRKKEFLQKKKERELEQPEIKKEVQRTGVYTYNPLDNYSFIQGLHPKKIVVPDNVKEIALSAFYECASLQEINIPNSVKEIGDSAFYGCYSLQKINLPNSVEKIGNEAFSYCHFLQKINIPNSMKEIGNYVFYNCFYLQEINIPSNIEKIGCSAFGNCASLKEMVIPNSVKKIGSGAFCHCLSLQKIVLSNSIEEIGYRAFDSCISLKEIKIKGEYRLQIFKNTGLTDNVILNWVDAGIKETVADTKQ